MKKRILILSLLTLGSLCQALETSPSGSANYVALPSTTIVILPDTFSEAEAHKLSLQRDGADQQTAVLEQEWQLLRSQKIGDAMFTGVSNSSKFEDLFSVVSYEFATVIQLKTPRVETILERKVLAQRYLARLNILAQRWPDRFSQVVIAGIGRGADVGRAIMDLSASNFSNTVPWIKNIHNLVSVGDSRKLIKLLGIIQDGNQPLTGPNQVSKESLVVAMKSLETTMRALTKGLENLRNNVTPDDKMYKRGISKIYTYYVLTIFGFMEELAKLQSTQAVQTAIKAATLTSDIIQDPEFKGKLLSFLQIWMAQPDKNMALFLIKELAGNQKISDLSEIFSEGNTYRELPVVGRIYFLAIKDAILQNSLQLTQSIDSLANEQDPARFLNSLNKHMAGLATAITEIKKGLVDMGQPLDSNSDGMLHLEFEDSTNPKLDRALFIKILDATSGSAGAATRAGI